MTMRGSAAVKAIIGVIIVIIIVIGTRMISKLTASPLPKFSRIVGAVSQATTLMEQYRNRPFSDLEPIVIEEEFGDSFSSEVNIERLKTNLAMITVSVFWDETRNPKRCIKLATLVSNQGPIP